MPTGGEIEHAGCFSGLFGGRRQYTNTSRRHSKGTLASAISGVQRGTQDELPKDPQFASSCNFSGGLEDGNLPSYSQSVPNSIFRPEVLKTIEQELDKLDPDLRDLSLRIHDHPELMFEERYAHDQLTAFMALHGFTVSRHYLGLETAWRADFHHGIGGRVLGVNAEMDALPGIGHACGHNLIAMAGVAIAIAVKLALQAHDVPGTVVLLDADTACGLTAEESGGGKQILLGRGAYEGMDACIMQVIFQQNLTALPLLIAHASASPWEGVNALDAAFIAYSSISVLRQQIKPSHRVHGILQGKNWTPNVIPDYAKMKWIVRAPTWDEVLILRDRVINCLKAASISTGCRVTITESDRYYNLRQNLVIAQDFASTAQQRFGFHTIYPTNSEGLTASTDFGNISYAHPAFHPVYSITTDPNSSNHTPGFEKASRTRAAHKATMKVAKSLALTGFRVLDDCAFYSQVRKAFEENGPQV
ncbi:hypothetical protein EW146_g6688 [Bondarzewia mesenterica]|uniref:Peptidase M20 dimerisation domain-containing protein n=1 Tax=Bondarzewia mesenterica TaxID=1095465 RepID=A0A4S4LMT4_9AGAM|nr:hypothetical protein EW146_g6688 [Bondarzewia mesenterica]